MRNRSATSDGADRLPDGDGGRRRRHHVLRAGRHARAIVHRERSGRQLRRHGIQRPCVVAGDTQRIVAGLQRRVLPRPLRHPRAGRLPVAAQHGPRQQRIVGAPDRRPHHAVRSAEFRRPFRHARKRRIELRPARHQRPRGLGDRQREHVAALPARRFWRHLLHARDRDAIPISDAWRVRRVPRGWSRAVPQVAAAFPKAGHARSCSRART